MSTAYGRLYMMPYLRLAQGRAQKDNSRLALRTAAVA